MSGTNSEQNSGDKKIRVLVVDDHPIIIEGVEKILSGDKDILMIGSAITAKTALEHLESNHPDVVLLDLALHGTEDGLETARIIRATHPEIYIIIFTTDRNNTREMLQLCLEFGVHGYLLKDKSTSEIIAAIRAVYEGKTWIDPTISADLLITKTTTQEIRALLTPKEIEVLLLLAEALSNKDLAHKLHIAESTVAKHLSNIYSKIGVRSRSAAIKWVNSSGLHK